MGSRERDVPVVFVRNVYNYDMAKASVESAYVDESGEVIVQQGPAEDCDINTIVRRFGITGQLPEGARMPTYGDFASVGDFQTCMNVLLEAEREFMKLPAEVRREFDNDPGRFVDFCENPENIDRVEKLGFLSDAAVARREAARKAAAAPAAPGPGGASGASPGPAQGS